MKIGSVELENNLILAPMAGVSDLPFRLLCREMGAGMAVMEMVSAKAILYKNKNTAELMRTVPQERPVSLQLFGSDPDIVSDIAQQIEEYPFDILDFNMGCPVPKVVKNGEGSALMRDPKLAVRIVRETVKKIRKPMTVKIRKGFNDEEVNAVEVAKMLEDAGATAIAVHGRTREQYYSGKADWDIIRQVKEAVRIPVIGNGDVTGPGSARALQEQTGCDGIMIGRAARGNPWIFRQILQERRNEDRIPGDACSRVQGNDRAENAPFGQAQGSNRSQNFEGSRIPVMEISGSVPDAGRPDTAELRGMILRHARMVVEMDGEDIGIRKMRKHVAWYTTGCRHASKLRGLSNQISTLEDLRNLLTLLDA